MSFYAGNPSAYGGGYGGQYSMAMPGTTAYCGMPGTAAYGGYGAQSYGYGYGYPGCAGPMMSPYAGQNQMMMPAMGHMMQPYGDMNMVGYMSMPGYGGMHGGFGAYPHGVYRRRKHKTCCGSSHHDEDHYYDDPYEYEYDRRHKKHGSEC
jgi:hypothetical protein